MNIKLGVHKSTSAAKELHQITFTKDIGDQQFNIQAFINRLTIILLL